MWVNPGHIGLDLSTCKSDSIAKRGLRNVEAILVTNAPGHIRPLRVASFPHRAAHAFEPSGSASQEYADARMTCGIVFQNLKALVIKGRIGGPRIHFIECG